MIRVAKITFKRLMQDKSVTIALFIVPIMIILVFSRMTAVPSNDQTIYRVGVLTSQKEYLPIPQGNNIRWITFETEDALRADVLLGRVAAGLVMDEKGMSKVYALSEERGSFILHEIEYGIPKSAREEVNPTSQISVIMNFLINYMLFSMIFIATDVTALKSQRILHRMHAMPISPAHMFGGQVMAFLGLLCAQIMEIMIVIYLVLGVPLSSHILLSTLILLLMSGVILSFGLLVTRMTDNTGIVPLICNGIAVPLMMISGTFMPVDHHPIMSKLKVLSPQYWVVDAIAVLNAGSQRIGIHILVLAVMGVTVFSIAIAGRKVSLS